MTNLVNPYRFVSGGAVLILDTFTDSDSTNIDAHTPDIDVVGGGWTAYGIPMDIQSNTLRMVGNGQKKVSIDSGNANVHVQLAFQSDDLSGERMDIMLRFIDTGNYWRLYIQPTFYRLLETTGGSTFTRGTVTKTISNDTEYICNLKGDGDTISFWVDDDEPTEFVSTVHQNNTICGIWGFGAAGVLAFTDNFLVVEA